MLQTGREIKNNYILLTLRNVDKFPYWEAKIAFLVTTPTVIDQFCDHAAGKRVTWKLVDGPNALPTAECQPALSAKFKFNVCAVCGVLYGPHILYSLVIRPFTESYNH